jgi:hypothetical protein
LHSTSLAASATCTHPTPREWPIGEKLFEKVGKEFRIKKTLVSELYYEVGRELQEQDLEEQEAEREAAEKEASAKK